MNRILSALLGALLIAGSAVARDTRHMFPVRDALNSSNGKVKLDPNIKLYFGDTPHPKVVRDFGEFTSNKKTNAFNKSDRVACEWAFMSAMLSFQDRAKELGGNAVINIKSYYKKDLRVSRSEYLCGAGATVAGVTFKGTVAKLAH
ncbi:MAG: excinuclease ATPase subunit [Betaproteobacteria bacterium]|nr:excinuclease ATPase subunit [Betaproteobacteria bacterium]